MDIQIIPATIKHAKMMADHLREEDRLECFALGSFPEAALSNSVEISEEAWVCLVGREPAMIGGIAPAAVLGETWRVWMLTTPQIEKIKITAAIISKRFIKHARKKYPHLENYVDARYKLALKWAKWLGFTIDKAVPAGKQKKLIQRIHMKGEN